MSELPPEIGNLNNLRFLELINDQLVELPPEIGQLSNLQELSPHNNQLRELPPEIGNLTNLQRLSLSHNQLSELPPEIGNLSNLQDLGLSDNPLTMPPPEIISQGTEAILEYLRERQAMLERQRVLTVVGGVGLAALGVLAFYLRRRSKGKKKRG